MKEKTFSASLAAVESARSASDSAAAPHAAPTPGPWRVGPHYKSDVESREGRICECGPFGSPRAEANAHLIAAAPDLYEAMKRIVEYDYKHGPSYHGTREGYEWYGKSPDVWNSAKAAIAKAEGRQS